MAPFTSTLQRLRRRRFVALTVALGILLQGLMPMTASASTVKGEAAELFAGTVAICSPFGITHADVEPATAPAPVQPGHAGGCLDCCPCIAAALPVPDIACLCTGAHEAVPQQVLWQQPSTGRIAFRSQSPRAPPLS